MPFTPPPRNTPSASSIQSISSGSAQRGVGDGSQCGQAGGEQVLTSAGGDEGLLGSEEERWASGDRHLPGTCDVTEDEVLVEPEAEDVARVEPLRLNALELARDAGVEADEDEPAVLLVVVGAVG